MTRNSFLTFLQTEKSNFNGSKSRDWSGTDSWLMDETPSGGHGKAAALVTPTKTQLMILLFPGVLKYETKGPVPDIVISRIRFQCMRFERETDTNIHTIAEPTLSPSLFLPPPLMWLVLGA